MGTTELIDETLREGRARAFIEPSPAETIALVHRIHEVTGIARFCVGFGASSDDMQTLQVLLDATDRGELPELRWRLFATYDTVDAVVTMLRGMPARHRERLILGVSCRASEKLARPVDGVFAEARDFRLGSSKDVPWSRLAASLQEGYTEAVSRARSLGLAEVHSIVMDAFRAHAEDTVGFAAAAIAGGATSVHLHDTVGVAMPHTGTERIAEIAAGVPGVALGVHFHNDFGLAVANTLASIEAGVASVDVTINGLGNRAGNAGTAQVLVAMRELLGIAMPRVRFERLMELARAVEDHFSLGDSPYAPITGRLTYLDEASFRSHLMVEDERAWLPFAPSLVGGQLRIVHSSGSGRRALEGTLALRREQLSSRGVVLDSALVERAYGWVRRQQAMREAELRPQTRATHDRYEDELRRSYVFDEEVVREALLSDGRFDRGDEPRAVPRGPK